MRLTVDSFIMENRTHTGCPPCKWFLEDGFGGKCLNPKLCTGMQIDFNTKELQVEEIKQGEIK